MSWTPSAAERISVLVVGESHFETIRKRAAPPRWGRKVIAGARTEVVLP